MPVVRSLLSMRFGQALAHVLCAVLTVFRCRVAIGAELTQSHHLFVNSVQKRLNQFCYENFHKFFDRSLWFGRQAFHTQLVVDARIRQRSILSQSRYVLVAHVDSTFWDIVCRNEGRLADLNFLVPSTPLRVFPVRRRHHPIWKGRFCALCFNTWHVPLGCLVFENTGRPFRPFRHVPTWWMPFSWQNIRTDQQLNQLSQAIIYPFLK